MVQYTEGIGIGVVFLLYVSVSVDVSLNHVKTSHK